MHLQCRGVLQYAQRRRIVAHCARVTALCDVRCEVYGAAGVLFSTSHCTACHTRTMVKSVLFGLGGLSLGLGTGLGLAQTGVLSVVGLGKKRGISSLGARAAAVGGCHSICGAKRSTTLDERRTLDQMWPARWSGSACYSLTAQPLVARTWA